MTSSTTGGIIPEEGDCAASVPQDEDSRKINTFVFLDLETSDLLPIDKPKIMEICMIAVHRSALCQAGTDDIPRVIDKMTLCFNPNKQVSPRSFELTGLDNFNLADSARNILDEDDVKMMRLFLSRQQQPVCLVAHNGERFDFRLLRTELSKIKQNLGDGILCADSLIGFYETDQEENLMSGMDSQATSSQSTSHVQSGTQPSKRICLEVTPDKQISMSSSQTPKPFQRVMPYSRGSPSYSLANIFKRTFGGQSIARAHNAEGDVLGLIRVCMTRGEKLCHWMDKKARSLNDVELYYMPSPPRSSKRSLQF